MKLGLYTDPHVTQTSSIIVGRKGSFSGRLDNIIQSFDWMNNLFQEQKVDAIVCLGDMTDKPNLTSEEITALDKCNAYNHYFIVGNHCRSNKSGEINSLSLFKHVIYKPDYLFDNSIYVIPYNTELIDLNQLNPKPKVILSHNDIYGYNFGGGHVSSSGYKIEDIINNCQLYINGHLHNGGWLINNRIMNLGMLSGVNFSSCNGQWNPSVAILDTETCQIQLYENPEAYKFKKETFDSLPKIKKYLDDLDGKNYVLQVKVPNKISESTRALISQSDKVIASRILVISDDSKVITKSEFKFNQSSVYDRLRKFVNENNPTYDIKLINKIIDMIESKEGVE